MSLIGDKGPMGDPGLEGAPGNRGSMGERGPQGVEGEVGNVGMMVICQILYYIFKTHTHHDVKMHTNTS